MRQSINRIWVVNPPLVSIAYRGNLQCIKKLIDLKGIPHKGLMLLVAQMMIRNALFKLRR